MGKLCRGGRRVQIETGVENRVAGGKSVWKNEVRDEGGVCRGGGVPYE